MKHLHVTKEVFLSIKNGSKRIEYRPYNKYYYRLFRINDERDLILDKVKIYCGYPKKNDNKKVMTFSCRIKLKTIEKNKIDPLFIKYYPFYKNDKMITLYFIELGCLNESKY